MAFPQSALVYFQFVFAAITPILALGSVLGRVNFKAWIPFVPAVDHVRLRVDAFLIWGGGFFAQHGAVDYSGGYVIHLSAGVAGFVAAAVIGPRLQRDREIDAPNNVAMVAVGAGLLWLGWNGFNGGDPYAANMSASAAVLNTNLCTAVAFLVWVGVGLPDRPQAVADRRRQRMITGLVAITPAAGYVNGWGAIAIGRHRLDDRVLRAQLPEPPAAVPQRRRHARRDLHARVRRPGRRPAGRHLRRPEHGAVLQDRQARPDRRRRRGRSDPRQRHAAQVAVPRRAVGDLLDRRWSRSCCSSWSGCSSRCGCPRRTWRSATSPSTATRCTRPTFPRSGTRAGSPASPPGQQRGRCADDGLTQPIGLTTPSMSRAPRRWRSCRDAVAGDGLERVARVGLGGARASGGGHLPVARQPPVVWPVGAAVPAAVRRRDGSVSRPSADGRCVATLDGSTVGGRR